MFMLFQPLSEAAVALKKQAYKLALTVARRGSANRVNEIFILRATNLEPDRVKVQVIETPVYMVCGYGGRDGSTNYYTPGSLAQYTNGLSALLRDSLKIEEGAVVPNIPNEALKLYLPNGSGILQLGDLPAWNAYRMALNSTTSNVQNSCTAVMVGVCPDLAETDPPPKLRSYMLCRMNGTMAGGSYIGNAFGTTPANPAPLAGHPALNGERMVDRPNSMGGIEFGPDSLGLGADEQLNLAWTPIEWNYGLGVAPAVVVRLDSEGALQETSLLFAAYRVSNTGGAYVPSLDWVQRVANGDIPAGGQSDALPALPQLTAGYAFPFWAEANLVMTERAASTPAVTFRDPNASGFLFAAGLGHGDQRTRMLGVVEVKAALNGPTVSVRGVRSSDGATVTENRPSLESYRTTTYVLDMDAEGVVSLHLLNSYEFDRYDTSTPLQPVRTTSFAGVTTTPTVENPFGEPRLFCAQYKTVYKLVPATPDGPPPANEQGEPAHVAADSVAGSSNPDEQEWCFLTHDGSRTAIDFGAYFPLLLTSISDLFDGRRSWFGTTAMVPVVERQGNAQPIPACQFAPGHMACLVAPKAQFDQDLLNIHVAVVHVATGVVVALSNALVTSYVMGTYRLTCIEQGTLNEAGGLATYGRLIFAASTVADVEGSGSDGYYSVTDLNSLSWVALEPSNTIPQYGGNALVRADMGVTTNLTGVTPTPV